MLALTACVLGNRIPRKPSGTLNVTRIWTYRTSDTITSSPAQAAGTVYIKTDKSLIALSQGGGAVRWHVESLSDTPLSIAPSVIGSAVIVTETGSRIAAYDARTGDLLWRSIAVTVSGLYAPKVDALAYAEGLIIVARHDWALTAYVATTGKVLWQQPLSDRATQYLASGDKFVYLAVGDTLSAYDLSTGMPLWEHRFGGLIGPIRMSGSTLYLVDQSAPRLIALDTESRKVLWEADYQEVQPFEVGCIAEAAGRILIAEKRLIAVSETDGRVEWTSIRTGRLECPANWGENLYVRNTTSTLYAFNLTTGAETGTLPVEANTPMKDQPNRGPITANGLLITPIGSHEVIALQP
jgi:outer membrane protein assembly factor BamB